MLGLAQADVWERLRQRLSPLPGACQGKHGVGMGAEEIQSRPRVSAVYRGLWSSSALLLLSLVCLFILHMILLPMHHASNLQALDRAVAKADPFGKLLRSWTTGKVPALTRGVYEWVGGMGDGHRLVRDLWYSQHKTINKKKVQIS